MCQTNNRSRRARRGFTLVELMVVVAIILFVILFILTPSYERAIDLKMMVYCQFNARNISLASVQYCTDNDRRLVGPNWGQFDTDVRDQHGWLYDDQQMDAPEHAMTGDLWQYLLDLSVYRCPADHPDPTAVPNRPYNSRMVTSYVSNGSFVRYGDRSLYDYATDTWQTYRINHFRPRDVLFWEPDETKGEAGSWGWWWDGSDFPWEGVTRRHLDNEDSVAYGNASFVNADGSVEWISIADYYDMVYTNWRNGDYTIIQTRTRLWNTPGTENGR